ncbi:MAG: hypothetical protein ACJAT4_000990 [Granulosicoccus sp.]|jgi:hypothetical protein
MDKIKFLVAVFLLSVFSNLNAQSCLSNGISFANQGQVNDFRMNYPGCKIIEGGITVNDTGVSNFDSLIDLTTIEGTLYLNDNSSINLQGLQNVTSLGGLRIRDDGLNHFDGLENVEIIYGDFEISDCHGVSTTGFSSLKEVQGDFYIYDNSEIDFVDLPLLERIGGDLTIEDNGVTNLEALISIKEIGGKLLIIDNPQLSSLAGLDSIDANSITDLILEASDNLSFCAVKSICDYLSMNIGPSTIGENLMGCNTADEILVLCMEEPTSILNQQKSTIQISPNPVIDRLKISHDLSTVSEILVLNSNGKEIVHLWSDASELNVAHLNAGMYVLILKSGDDIYYHKFVKLQ